MAFEKLDGFYRGTVLEHMSMGRCRVFIYGVYPDEWKNSPEKLPPAEQASMLFAGSNMGNGVFSYPNVGATVWCFFENGDQNYPVYFAATLGGQMAQSRWNEARCNCTDENIANGDDAYVHKIDVNKTTIKLWESGYIEIITKSGASDTAKVTVDGKGNIAISSTQQIQVSAPAINLQADDRMTLQSPTIKITADSMLEVVTPIYSNINDVSHSTTAPSINMDASAGMFAAKGKRHTTIIN